MKAGDGIPAAFTLLAAFLFTLQAPGSASSMGSLPTGPSERGNDSEISSSPGLTDMLPARVRLLPDRQFQAVLQQEIAAARSEVVLGFHLFSAEEGRDNRAGAVADLLAETAARGVKVIVVLEIGKEVSPITKANRGTARLLRRRGIHVYGDMSGTTVHSNVAVIDRRVVFLGSHHLTQQSLGRYRELSLVVDSPTIATAVLGFIESLDPMVYREP
jgi:phosphatidylserine/phosphatidylglycerophosphate/cardiolipin synthase-like enzyme